jgi:energy-coupling factor transport system permease protein
MKGARQVTNSDKPSSGRYQWRVVDIVVASVLGVASGVIFWAFDQLWNGVSLPLALLPGLIAIINGGWLFAGVIGGLVIRKPGAALFVEILAAFVEMILGSPYGWTAVLSGVVQGLGAEIVFAIFLYRTWSWWVAVLAGIAAAIGLIVQDFIMFDAAQGLEYKIVFAICSLVSGAVVAGFLGWLAVRGLARTGALGRFAAGREVTAQV